MSDFAWLPPQYREHAAEFQGEELDRSLRQEQIFRGEMYMQGWCDCRDGKQPDDNDIEYQKGYSDRYQLEQEWSNGT